VAERRADDPSTYGAGVGHLNVEIKARCPSPQLALDLLIGLGARLQGVDFQTDVYYRVPKGRLKLRRGTIENNLIQYDRPDLQAPKQSQVHLLAVGADRALDEVLDAALHRDVVVSKQRHILWLGNVKFHVDEVTGLGSFLEIEAIDRDGTLGSQHLLAQCQQYLQLLDVHDNDLEGRSYSDILRRPPDAQGPAY